MRLFGEQTHAYLRTDTRVYKDRSTKTEVGGASQYVCGSMHMRMYRQGHARMHTNARVVICVWCCCDVVSCRQCARQRMPKWFEWYSAFSLMVTLVWFFTEALRLLRMLAGGDRD